MNTRRRRAPTGGCSRRGNRLRGGSLRCSITIASGSISPRPARRRVRINPSVAKHLVAEVVRLRRFARHVRPDISPPIITNRDMYGRSDYTTMNIVCRKSHDIPLRNKCNHRVKSCAPFFRSPPYSVCSEPNDCGRHIHYRGFSESRAKLSIPASRKPVPEILTSKE
jgi:hypothetical protein